MYPKDQRGGRSILSRAIGRPRVIPSRREDPDNPLRPPTAHAPGSGRPRGSRGASHNPSKSRGRSAGGQAPPAVPLFAADARLQRRVALKVMIPELARETGFRTRMISESRAAAALGHPHIVPVFQADEADGILYAAMRYVTGGDTRSLL